MRPGWFGFILLVAIATTREAVLPDVFRPMSDAKIEAQCRPFFHNACSEAMGRWLQRFAYGDDDQAHAKRIDTSDAFVYEGKHPRLSSHFLEFRGPADGTVFVYGQAGPPRGSAVYDRVHRLAFYGQGCCSWTEAVAAADVPPPPRYVKASDLKSLSTLRGVRLGQTEAQIKKIYGPAILRPVGGHPGVGVLSYTTLQPINAKADADTTCGQFEKFYLRGNRLIVIRLENAC